MNNNESIIDGFLAANGFTRVYANMTQAAKAATRLCHAGFNAFAVQSGRSMRFVVRIV